MLDSVLNDPIQKENLITLASSKIYLDEVKHAKASLPPELDKEVIFENLYYIVKVVETFEDEEFSETFRELFNLVFGEFIK